MRVLIYTPGPPSRSDALLQQLAAWIREHGHGIGYRYFGAYGDYEPADVVVTIGWNSAIQRIHTDHVSKGKMSLSLSDGFIKRGWNPGSYFAVTRNGLHAYGDQITGMPGDRWSRLNIRLREWQNNKDGHILIAHQHVDTFDGRSRQPWFHETVRVLSEITDRRVILRPHPRDRERRELPNGCLISNRPYREDVETAWAIVTYDSNMAVDATLYGIPCFTAGKTRADGITCRDLARIEDPPKPDRQQWAHDLAYTQWNVQELRAGLPWIHLIDKALSQGGNTALEADYPYADGWEEVTTALTDWNVKDGQTPDDVRREIENPSVYDAIQARRALFAKMPVPELVDYLIKKGIRAMETEEREILIGRAIHASL